MVVWRCVQTLYCDVRHLLTYVKEIHGGTFRRVALAALLDALKHPPSAAAAAAARRSKGVRSVLVPLTNLFIYLLCFDTVGWAAGRASGL